MANPKQENIQKLNEMIEGIRIAMMTTVEEDGSLRSRPMATQDRPFDGNLWFFTRKDSPKIQEIEREHRVNVSYSDVSKSRYVSISGRASEVHDRSIAERYWSPMLKAWFPEGLDDPGLTLLKVDVEHAEYWDSGQSRMTQLFQMAKAIAKGTTAEQEGIGENEKLDMTG